MPENNSVWAEVVTVKDGDSWLVQIDSQIKEIRLRGLDCPERNQHGGRWVTAQVKQMVETHEVRLSNIAPDKYGRLLTDVHSAHYGDVILRMTFLGLGWVRTPRNEREKDLHAAMLVAKHLKRGIWGSPHPEAPWCFRARTRGGFINLRKRFHIRFRRA